MLLLLNALILQACELNKMSRFCVEHGAVVHEDVLRTTRKGLTTGLEGWWRKGVEVAGGRETFRKAFSCRG